MVHVMFNSFNDQYSYNNIKHKQACILSRALKWRENKNPNRGVYPLEAMEQVSLPPFPSHLSFLLSTAFPPLP